MLGRSLGNYGVVSQIGEGGMGVVYLARHVTLGRRAAIKVLRPALSADKELVSRFFKEARAATSVRNPGIVEVYDFGFLEDRTAYIIMEYLDGESLGARMRRGRPTLAATLTIVRAIARALQAAHDQGIVHRDLKPDNVFLVPDSELPSGERVKLLDFGIAKLTYEISASGHTKTGTVMGTPAYMSPEQCRGAGTVDQRADLYSLGCVLHEMLCGRPPFIAEGPGDVIARHLCFEPSPVRSYRPDIPLEIEDIVGRLLKKEPRDRYRSANELVHAIDQLAAMTPLVEVRSQQTASDLVATLAIVNEKTTLTRAASSSTVRNEAKTRRFGIVAGVVTVAGLVLVAIFFVVARAARNEEAGPRSAQGAPPIATTAHERTVVPTPPASLPPVAPNLAAAPTSGSSSVGDTSARATTIQPATAVGDATTQPNSPAPFTPPPEVIKPRDPVESAVPGERPKRDKGASTAIASARSADRAQPNGTKVHGAAKPTGAAKPAGTTEPNDTASATATANPGGPPGTTAPAGPSDADCARASFTQVLDAKAPSQAAVKSAKDLLMRCRSSMDLEIYDDIHRRLIGKY
jgi:eukaryotic-like serine/threonine-protein kinase